MNLSRKQREQINNTEKTLGITLTNEQIRGVLGLPEPVIEPVIKQSVRVPKETI